MKILILNYEYPPFGGGAGHCTYFLAEKLVQYGIKVDILTSRYGKSDQKFKASGPRVFKVPILRKGVHHCGLRGALSYILLSSLKIRSLIRKNRYDLIHCFFCLPTGLLFYVIRDFKDIPKVISLRGSDVPNYDPYNLSLKIFHFILRPFSIDIIRNANKVVANSHFLKKLAVKHLKRQDITDIPNGVDTDFFKPNFDRKTESNSTELLCVSRLIERKGIEDIIKAMVYFKNADVNLRIIGSGSSENEIRKLIDDNNLAHMIKLLGYIPQSDLPPYYNSSDIFVLPSLTESGGQAFLEAMSCGLPVVSSTAGGIPEYVYHGYNGLLVSPGDVEGLYMALKKLIEDKKLRGIMGRNSREKILSHNSWETITDRYLEVYRQKILS